METVDSMRAQAHALARGYLKRENSAALNSVRAWMGTDERRRDLFVEVLPQAIVDTVNERVTVVLPPVEPMSPPTLPTETSDRYTSVQKLAFYWMRCVETVATKELTQACRAWRANDPQHYIEFRRWRDLWHAYLSHKAGRIISGLPTTEVVELKTLLPSQLEALVADERDCVLQQRTAWLRRPSARRQKFSTALDQHCEHILEFLSCRLDLCEQTQVEVIPELTQRRLVLLAGQVVIRFDEHLYWPLEIDVDCIRLVAESGSFSVHRHAQHDIEVLVVEGVVRARSLPDAQLPAGLCDLNKTCIADYRMRITPEGVTVAAA